MSVNKTRPDYYQSMGGGSECWDVIESLGHAKSFYIGSILKYIWRHGKKPGEYVNDLYKAKTYLNRLIDLVEAEENNVRE